MTIPPQSCKVLINNRGRYLGSNPKNSRNPGNLINPVMKTIDETTNSAIKTT
jgi:hypothetical protein